MLILTVPDPILVVGAAAAWELYNRGPSVVLLTERPTETDRLHLDLDPYGRLRAAAQYSLTENPSRVRRL